MLSTTRNQRIGAVIAAVALMAAACASEEPTPRATPATPTTVVEASTTTTAPEELSACEDPAAEHLGDGRYERDGLVYELVDGNCLFRPNRPDDSATEAAEEAAAQDAAQTAEATSEQICVDDVCVDVPVDGSQVELPEGFTNHEHPAETEPDYEPGPSTEDPDASDEPESTTTTVATEPGESTPEAETTTTTAAPESEPAATTTTAPEPEPTTTSTTTTPPTTTTTAPEPPTTTAPLPEQVGNPIYFETNTTTNAPYCAAADVGCSPLLEIQVGTVLIHADYPDNPATVVDVVDSTVSSLSVIWVCVLGANPDVQYGRYRWTSTRTDGLYSIHRSTMGDYHRPC